MNNEVSLTKLKLYSTAYSPAEKVFVGIDYVKDENHIHCHGTYEDGTRFNRVYSINELTRFVL